MATLSKQASSSISMDRNQTRLNALGRVFAKTVRIITGRRDINVVMTTSGANQMPSVGFSDGKTIYVNTNMIEDLSKPIGLVRLMAVVYHEMCHLMFTTRDREYREQLYNEKALTAFNILEDQRIESMFVSMYRPAAKYFTEMNVQLFLVKEESWPTGMLFTHGRRYMPIEVRAALEERFSGTDYQKNQAKAIIDEYRLLSMTTQAELDRAYALSKMFSVLMRDLQASGNDCATQGRPDGTGTCSDHHHQPDSTTTNSEKQEQSDKVKEDTEKQDEAESDGEDGSGFWEDTIGEDEEPANDDADESLGDSDDETGEDEDGDSEWEDGEGAANDGDSEDSEQGETKDGSESEVGAPAGNSVNEERLTDSEIRELLNDVMDSVEQCEDVQNDIANMRQGIREAPLELDAPVRTGHERGVTASESVTLAKMEAEWRRLHARVEPGWNYRTNRGHLDVMRAHEAMQEPVFDDEEIYNEWDEGAEDSAGIEAVILLDTSGSMSRMADHASGVLYVLKRGMEAVDADVCVLGFDEVTRTLYQRGENTKQGRLQSFIADGGDTNPSIGIQNARRILNASKKPNRLLIIITDGEWSSSHTDPMSGLIVQSNYGDLLDGTDATRVFIGINSRFGGVSSTTYERHFHHTFIINNIEDITDKVRALVTGILNNAIQHRAV